MAGLSNGVKIGDTLTCKAKVVKMEEKDLSRSILTYEDFCRESCRKAWSVTVSESIMNNRGKHNG